MIHDDELPDRDPTAPLEEPGDRENCDLCGKPLDGEQYVHGWCADLESAASDQPDDWEARAQAIRDGDKQAIGEASIARADMLKKQMRGE